MRNVVSLMHMSLDGFVSGSKGEMDWIKLDDQGFTFVDKYIKEADTGLYGPKTFQMMESHWPGVLKDPKASGHQLTHAQWYEKAQKIVFSKKLDRLNSTSAKLFKENPSDAVAELKRQHGKNVMIFGSPGLVHSFMQLGLIDEYLIMINPIILGSGVSMFEGTNSRTDLRLISSSEFDNGVVGFHYKKC